MCLPPSSSVALPSAGAARQPGIEDVAEAAAALTQLVRVVTLPSPSSPQRQQKQQEGNNQSSSPASQQQGEEGAESRRGTNNTHCISEDDESSPPPPSSLPSSSSRSGHHHRSSRHSDEKSRHKKRHSHNKKRHRHHRRSATTTAPSSKYGGGRSNSSNNNSTRPEIFPLRLHSMLSSSSGVSSHILTWLPHGRSFVILRPDLFVESVLPAFFPESSAGRGGGTKSSSKYPSFTRKLNRWGLRQINRGPDSGAFHHPLFRRDEPELCHGMECQKKSGIVKGGRRGRRKAADAADADASPPTASSVANKVAQKNSKVPEPSPAIQRQQQQQEAAEQTPVTPPRECRRVPLKKRKLSFPPPPPEEEDSPPATAAAATSPPLPTQGQQQVGVGGGMAPYPRRSFSHIAPRRSNEATGPSAAGANHHHGAHEAAVMALLRSSLLHSQQVAPPSSNANALAAGVASTTAQANHHPATMIQPRPPLPRHQHHQHQHQHHPAPQQQLMHMHMPIRPAVVHRADKASSPTAAALRMPLLVSDVKQANGGGGTSQGATSAAYIRRSAEEHKTMLYRAFLQAMSA